MRAESGPLGHFSRRRLLLFAGTAMVAFAITILVIGLGIKGPKIFEFEFAGSAQRATEIMAEWGDQGRDGARLSLWIDFGFMLSYGAFFTLAAIATRESAREQGWRTLATVGIAAPFFAAFAVLFDAAENVALLLILGGRGGNVAPLFATACASLKSLLITLGIVYALLGLIVRLLGIDGNELKTLVKRDACPMQQAGGTFSVLGTLRGGRTDD